MLEVAPSPPAEQPQPVVPPAPAEHHMSFHEVLSALNPLQYLPVIGTIYRAVTGDQIPEPVRRIGSLIASALLGGPIGAAIDVAVTAAEKITGIDLDQTGQNLLAGLGPADHRLGTPGAAPAPDAPPAVPASLAAQPPARPAAGPAASPAALAASLAPRPAEAWSPAQLAAYGVTSIGDGTLRLANLTGADVLNALELSRVQLAQTAYNRARLLAA